MMPAMGGPAVIGSEKSPRRVPMAWPAPRGPQRSKAMGPIKVTKHPSNRPMMAQSSIKTSYWCPSAYRAVVISIVHMPRNKNES